MDKSLKPIRIPKDPKVHFQAKITGDAARLILEFQNAKRIQNIEPPGKARATQILLCELYNLKYKSK